jgi:hypothetical protein
MSLWIRWSGAVVRQKEGEGGRNKHNDIKMKIKVG